MDKNVYHRKTKIVATIGPASSSPEVIEKMILAGLNVARLNFSHGDHPSHLANVKLIREISSKMGRVVAILQDLSGPKIRLGNIRERKLETGSTVNLVYGTEDLPEDIPINYEFLIEDINVGDRILLSDGKLELLVTGKTDTSLQAEVIVGGVISSHKGVNLPNSNLRVQAFTEKDKYDLTCGLEAGVDFVAMSFVRHANDLKPIKEMFKRSSTPPLLIAKIEKPQAVERIDEILQAADGIMVARGDLGVEMPLEAVPIIQKRLIKAARQNGKIVITATQMLGSMVQNPRPTRAEVADVANAILDGTDAVMLSDESAVGAYPIDAVSILDRVSKETEPSIDYQKYLREKTAEDINPVGGAITKAVAILANDLSAKAIVAATQGGSTARLVSHLRQPTPVIGLTSNSMTYRQLAISWGVIPALIQPCESILLLEQLASELLVKHGLAKKGDCVFLTCGLPLQTTGTTNLIKLLEIGEISA